MKKRFEALDLLKALAIFLIVFYHNIAGSCEMTGQPGFENYGNYYVRALLDVGVPLFFLVNGALLLNRPLDVRAHCFRTLRLIGITFLWAALTLAYIILFRNVEIGSVREFIACLWNWDHAALTHFWFLRTLAVIYLLFPLLKAAFDSCRQGFLFFLGVTALFVFGNSLLSMGLNVGKALLGAPVPSGWYEFFNRYDFLRGKNGFALVYFLVGGLAWESREKLDRKPLRRGAAALFPVLCLLLTCYGAAVSRLTGETWDLVWQGYSTVFTLGAVLSLFVLSLGAEGRGPAWLRGLLRLVGENTLGIFFLHVLLGGTLSSWYRSLPGCQLLPVNLLYAALLTLCCLGLSLLLKKIPGVRRILN